MQQEKPFEHQLGPANGSSLESDGASGIDPSLSHQRNLGIEDILGQLRGVTMRDPLFLDDQALELEPDLASGSGKKLQELQEQFVSDLSQENFEGILHNLERQFDEDDENIARKASSVEQLVIRLLMDEFNELQQSAELKIIDVGDE